MRHYSTFYTLRFAAVVCIVCSLLVSTSAVTLKKRQEANALLEKQRSVLYAAGLLKPGQPASRGEIAELFGSIEPRIVDLGTGEFSDAVDPLTYDPARALKDPVMSMEAPPNNDAQIRRLPKYALVYEVLQDGEVDMLVLPVEGKGLWSTLYGFLALDSNTRTIRGITFYQHGETPGLGGEIDNPKWKALWIGRQAFDSDWNVVIAVIKGRAGSPEDDPHRVDGLSGATLTTRGVSALVQFWLGEDGFGPFLEEFREGRNV